MKKHIFKNLALLLLAAMAITSCSNTNTKTLETLSKEKRESAQDKTVEVVQSKDVDESKCHEDYICYNRIVTAYNGIFSEIEEGMSEFVSGNSFDCLSRELQTLVKKTWDTPGCTYPDFDISTGESAYGGYNEYEFDGGDWSTNFIASLNYEREKIYQAALQKHSIKVPFGYTVVSFKQNQQYVSRSGQVHVVMIYENCDWFIDDVIYANGQTLRDTLNGMIEAAS